MIEQPDTVSVEVAHFIVVVVVSPLVIGDGEHVVNSASTELSVHDSVLVDDLLSSSFSPSTCCSSSNCFVSFSSSVSWPSTAATAPGVIGPLIEPVIPETITEIQDSSEKRLSPQSLLVGFGVVSESDPSIFSLNLSNLAKLGALSSAWSTHAHKKGRIPLNSVSREFSVGTTAGLSIGDVLVGAIVIGIGIIGSLSVLSVLPGTPARLRVKFAGVGKGLSGVVLSV